MANSVWMIRAEGGTLIDFFLEKGVVSIGCARLGDLTNVTSREAIRRDIDAQYPENSQGRTSAWTGIVHRFRSVLQQGDGVVTYDPSQRVYHYGKIVSDYLYDPELNEEWPNHRRVEWVGRISRDELSTSAKSALGPVVTLFKISETAANEIVAKIEGKPIGPVVAEGDDEEHIDEEDLLEDIQARSREFIKDQLNRLSWEEMQELVAGLLRAMGYKTRVSPRGSDLGKDIVASPDGFGLEQPRIVVEVKHRPQTAMGSQDVRGFLGGRHKDDKGLYVSTGGFSKDAKYEADRAAIPITLMDLDELANAVVDHYEDMDMNTRVLIPLTKVYWPRPE